MKIRHLSVFAAVAAALFISCSGNEDQPEVRPSLKLEGSTIEFEKEGGSETVSLTTNVDWSSASDASWLKVSPSGGVASQSVQTITLTADKNDGATREATVTITAKTIEAKVKVTQKSPEDDGLTFVTIEELKRQTPGNGEWYKVTATIASIADYSYGNFYVVDNTGYIYVYGLTSEKQSTNDQSFSSLSLNVGDELTFVARLTQYNEILEAGGTVPAYYRTHKSGSYNGTKAASTSAGWLELPATSASDGFDIISHYMYAEGLAGNRSYTYSWNYDNLVANWVAYPMCKSFRGSGERTESYGFDPMLDVSKQPSLGRGTYQKGNGGAYNRGHQLPSADRLNRRENIEVFYGTNITPQYASSNEFSGKLEALMRNSWSANCDTLYVVTGCDLKGSDLYVLDRSSEPKKVTVPVGHYKVLLKYSVESGYAGLAIYLNNDNSYSDYSGSSTDDAKKYIKDKNLCMSIDALEEKLGIDFFVNLPKLVGEDKAKEIEAEKPEDNKFWWTE